MASDLMNTSVLVIDDDEFYVMLLQNILRELWITKVTTATDVDGAMVRLAELRKGERFDVILLDLDMPEVDGLQFLDGLRRAGATPDNFTPIIIITSHAARTNVVRAARLGISGFLVKPVRKAALKRAIRAALDAPGATVATPEHNMRDSGDPFA